MNPDPTSLDRLHDIVQAPPIPWWPPAPGWYWLLTFVLVLVLVLVLETFLKWQHNRYRREALAELETQEHTLRDPSRRANALAAIAELLKRTALTAFSRDQVASLTGGAWYDFLDRAGNTNFAEGNGAALERVAYDPRSAAALDESKLEEIVSLVRHWIKYHDRDFERPSLSSFPSVQRPPVQDPC